MVGRKMKVAEKMAIMHDNELIVVRKDQLGK
jgi:hypothetical protein